MPEYRVFLPQAESTSGIVFHVAENDIHLQTKYHFLYIILADLIKIFGIATGLDIS